MQSPTLNLAHAHFKRTVRGITVIGTWFHTDDDSRSCLVLIRPGSETRADTVPCVVLGDEAYIFCGIDGVGEPHRAIPIAVEFARMLQMPLDQPTIVKIIRTIEDHIGDLVSIPPFLPPINDAPVLADVRITNRDTGEVEEMELRDVRS